MTIYRNPMQRTFYSLTIALTFAVALGACNGEGKQTAGGDTQAIDTAQFAPAPVGTSADSSVVRDTVPSQPVATHTAIISTTAGDIEVELYGLDVPRTTANFVGLAKKKFYDGILFHRVVPTFVIQAGDPLTKDPSMRDAWGSGGESIYGAKFEDELNPATPSYKRGYVEGTLAMANSGPNTNGSQFFIVLSAAGAGHLTPNYTIFGAVRGSMDAVKKIEQTGLQGEKPNDPVAIKSVTVTELPTAAQMPKNNLN